MKIFNDIIVEHINFIISKYPFFLHIIMKLFIIYDIIVYLYQFWILQKEMKCQILTIKCIFIYNNEIIKGVPKKMSHKDFGFQVWINEYFFILKTIFTFSLYINCTKFWARTIFFLRTCQNTAKNLLVSSLDCYHCD